jgi:hypothetical protein
MGCTSAKQVSAVPSDEEGRGKAYSNGDLFSGQYTLYTLLYSPSILTLATFNCKTSFPPEGYYLEI